MIFWIYNFLLIFLSPLWVPWMIWRASRRKEKTDWKQRTGDLPVIPPKEGVRRVWIHAVSVGEVMATLPVLKEIRRLDPNLEIVLSTTTSSGQQAARERAQGLFDHLVYFPIDVPRFVVAALARVRPKVVAMMETELWLNFLWASKQFRAQTFVMNARLSDKSTANARYLRPFYTAVAEQTDHVMAQTKQDQERFTALGFKDCQAVGNTKFDAAVAETAPDRDWRIELGIPPTAKVVVVGSTRSELEEKLVCDALASSGALSNENVWIIHAPRHIERSQAVLERYRDAGATSAGLRSEGSPERVTVLNTFGELGGIYSIASLAVIGGGFDDLGGQNLIQPLAHGVPVIHGPHMQNFRDAAESARQAGATETAATSTELAEKIKTLLFDQKVNKDMSDAARAFVACHLGAASLCAKAIVEAARTPDPPRRSR